jgi:hypothetical protein
MSARGVTLCFLQGATLHRSRNDLGATTNMLDAPLTCAELERVVEEALEIALFRGPINRVARTRCEAAREVRETVIHELGRYFGLADDEMPD